MEVFHWVLFRQLWFKLRICDHSMITKWFHQECVSNISEGFDIFLRIGIWMNGNKTIRNFRHGLYYGFIVCPSFCLQHKTVLNIQPSFVIIIKTRLHQCLYQYNLKVLSLSDRISYLIQQFSWLPQKMEQINLSFFSPFFFGIIRIQFDSVHAERPFI